MPQLTDTSAAVVAAIASIRGERSATARSSVRPESQSTTPAMGMDHSTRWTITSAGGICARAFI